MTHAKKAALLSGLLLPGIGQLTLKYYKTGLALIVVVFICMAIVITVSVQHALEIVNQMQAQGGVMDPAMLSQAIEQNRDRQNSGLINLAMFGLIGCWIFAVVHAYKMGKKKDLESTELE